MSLMQQHASDICRHANDEYQREANMDVSDFMRVIEKRVRDEAVNSTVKNLTQSTGNMSTPFLDLSAWYAQLQPDDRDRLNSLAYLAASHATLAFLSILDGAQAIEDSGDKGHLELYYVKGSIRRLLNDPTKEPLNDRLAFGM